MVNQTEAQSHARLTQGSLSYHASAIWPWEILIHFPFYSVWQQRKHERLHGRFQSWQMLNSKATDRSGLFDWPLALLEGDRSQAPRNRSLGSRNKWEQPSGKLVCFRFVVTIFGQVWIFWREVAICLGTVCFFLPNWSTSSHAPRGHCFHSPSLTLLQFHKAQLV